MFERWRAEKPKLQPTAPVEMGPEEQKLKGRLTEILAHVDNVTSWSDIQDAYLRAKPSLESNPSALLSPEEEGMLYKFALAAREQARAAGLERAG